MRNFLEFNITYRIPIGDAVTNAEALNQYTFDQSSFCLDALLWAIVGMNLDFQNHTFEPDAQAAYANCEHLALIACAFAEKMCEQYYGLRELTEVKSDEK